jgi:hypothetical protein
MDYGNIARHAPPVSFRRGETPGRRWRVENDFRHASRRGPDVRHSSPSAIVWKLSRASSKTRGRADRGAACGVSRIPRRQIARPRMMLANFGPKCHTGLAECTTGFAPSSMSTMTKLFRGFSLFLFLAALGGLAVLLASDVSHALRLTSFHQQSGALALILIGASYVSLQLSSGWPWNEKLKGVFLGFAFILWGSEQFLPASRVVTLMDSAVITIFVVDLGLIILDRLKRRDNQTP